MYVMKFFRIPIPLTVLLLTAVGCFAQNYDGDPPPKADVPYLLHAKNLIETEIIEAREEDRKKETAYVVPSASSPVRTPLAEPIFILLSEELSPQQFKLYDMKVQKGHRETAFPKNRKKKPPRSRYLKYNEVGENLYWIEVNEMLDNGEYCLTPDGSNSVFCFQVY